MLVNNAGIFEVKPFEQIDDEDWKRLFEVNVLSGVRLSRHYLAGMKSAIGDGLCSSRAKAQCKFLPR